LNNIVLITGGVRSGKSAQAEKYAAKYPEVVYIATCQALDEEMTERISAHQGRRPLHWQTIEDPLHLTNRLGSVSQDACLLIDCLGLWVSNHLLRDETTALANPQVFISTMEANASELVAMLRRRTGPSIIVTNEVGLGLVPPYKLGRVFRDALGRVNSLLAQQADEVYLCTAGIPLCLKREGVILHG